MSNDKSEKEMTTEEALKKTNEKLANNPKVIYTLVPEAIQQNLNQNNNFQSYGPPINNFNLDMNNAAPTIKPANRIPFFELNSIENIQKQIEYYFSDDNLMKDKFFKSKMDKYGFIDVAIIANFNRMKNAGIDIISILNIGKKSDKIEVVCNYMRSITWWKFTEPAYPQKPEQTRENNIPIAMSEEQIETWSVENFEASVATPVITSPSPQPSQTPTSGYGYTGTPQPQQLPSGMPPSFSPYDFTASQDYNYMRYLQTLQGFPLNLQMTNAQSIAAYQNFVANSAFYPQYNIYNSAEFLPPKFNYVSQFDENLSTIVAEEEQSVPANESTSTQVPGRGRRQFFGKRGRGWLSGKRGRGTRRGRGSRKDLGKSETPETQSEEKTRSEKTSRKLEKSQRESYEDEKRNKPESAAGSKPQRDNDSEETRRDKTTKESARNTEPVGKHSADSESIADAVNELTSQLEKTVLGDNGRNDEEKGNRENGRRQENGDEIEHVEREEADEKNSRSDAETKSSEDFEAIKDRDNLNPTESDNIKM